MAITPYYQETRDVNGVLTSVTTPTNLPLPAEVRNRWCFGLNLAKDDGSVMADDDILTFLKSAVANVERKLGVFLKPNVIVCNPSERGLTQGTDYDRAEAAYDYFARDYVQYGFMQLRERHVQSIEGLKLVLPNGMVIIDFTQNATLRQWIKLYGESGQLHLVPYAGDPTLFSLLGGTNSGYPFVTGMMNSDLPQMLYVDYTAGYPLYQIPEDIRNAVAKQAAIEVLAISGNAVAQGVASTSTGIDGLNESTSLSVSGDASVYGSLISQYTKDITDLFDPKVGAARMTERGITFVGL